MTHAFVLDPSRSVLLTQDRDPFVISGNKPAPAPPLILCALGADFAAHTHDEMTGLVNRQHFDVLFKQRAARSNHSALAVLYVELEGLARINAEHGRAVGDVLLVVLAHQAFELVPESPAVARWSGSKFAVILDRPIQAALACADRLAGGLSAPQEVGALRLTLDVSFVLCVYEQPHAIAERLHEAAGAVLGRDAANSPRICIAVNPLSRPVAAAEISTPESAARA